MRRTLVILLVLGVFLGARLVRPAPVRAFAPALGLAVATNPYFLAFLALLVVGGIVIASVDSGAYVMAAEWFENSDNWTVAQARYMLGLFRVWVDGSLAQDLALPMLGSYLGFLDEGFELGVIVGDWEYISGGITHWQVSSASGQYLGLASDDELEGSFGGLASTKSYAYVSGGTASYKVWTHWNGSWYSYACPAVTSVNEAARDLCSTLWNDNTDDLYIEVVSITEGEWLRIGTPIQWINTVPSPDTVYYHQVIALGQGALVTDYSEVDDLIIQVPPTLEDILGVEVDELTEQAWAEMMEGSEWLVMPNPDWVPPEDPDPQQGYIWLALAIIAGIASDLLDLPSKIGSVVSDTVGIGMFVGAEEEEGSFAYRWNELQGGASTRFPFNTIERLEIVPSLVFSGAAECLTFELPVMGESPELELCPDGPWEAFFALMRTWSRWAVLYMAIALLYHQAKGWAIHG